MNRYNRYGSWYANSKDSIYRPSNSRQQQEDTSSKSSRPRKQDPPPSPRNKVSDLILSDSSDSETENGVGNATDLNELAAVIDKYKALNPVQRITKLFEKKGDRHIQCFSTLARTILNKKKIHANSDSYKLLTWLASNAPTKTKRKIIRKEKDAFAHIFKHLNKTTSSKGSSVKRKSADTADTTENRKRLRSNKISEQVDTSSEEQTDVEEATTTTATHK